MLLPCFLEVARRTASEVFDVIELGTAAGLNLVWDRYRYRYAAGDWGPEEAPLELRGDERRPVPATVLARTPRVRSRVGIDLAPVDVTTDEGLLLLKAFVWADQHERLQRLERAAAAIRADPPQLVAGDLVELLPEYLARRRDDGLTLVYHTAVLGYVDLTERERARAALES